MVRVTVLVFLVALVGHPAVGAAAAGTGESSDAQAYAVSRNLNTQEPPDGKGYIPPFSVYPALEPKPVVTLTPLPVRFDWREQGKVTPVRNQGSCGACFAFAALGDFESELLIDGDRAYDFSENNVKECEWYRRNRYGVSGCGGGNYWRVANHLSAFGTVREACDPYQPYDASCRTGCPYVKTLLDWRCINWEEPIDAAVLKSYVHAYGPVFTAMYAGSNDAWEHELEAYNGSYTLYYTGAGKVNHAVLIVGWDDTLSHAGGQGAWIVKNSWGTNWGGTAGYGTQKGYFTIAYGSAKIGYLSSYLYEWQDYDPNGKLLLHDEAGYTAGTGYPPSKIGWGMCKYVMERDAILERVEFWAVDPVPDIDVYVYDDFNEGTLSGLLSSKVNSSFDYPGYHSISLSQPAEVVAGEDVYVVARITNATYTYPVPYDEFSPDNPENSWISSNGTSWAAFHRGEMGIRLRVLYDDVPPGEVIGFGAEGRDTSVVLTWTNPDDTDFDYALVTYSTSDFPASPDAGTPVENGAGGKFHDLPSTAMTYTHGGLENGTTYYYSVFAFDRSQNHAAAVAAEATPYDDAPPGLAISVFQNPLITNHLDIYVIASEAVVETSLVVTVGDQEVSMVVADQEERVFRHDYEIYDSGALPIEACARDLSMNRGCSSRTYAAARIGAVSGGRISSPDGLLSVVIPGGALSKDAYVLVGETAGPGGTIGGVNRTARIERAYSISPDGLAITGQVELAIACDPAGGDPGRLRHLAIARTCGETVEPLDSYLDRDAGRVVAYTDRLGTYVLLWDEGIENRDYVPAGLKLTQNLPNPFVDETAIFYAITAPAAVKLDIISVDGRLVREIDQGVLGPGSYEVTWDGTDRSGRPVASGVYMYRLSAGGESRVKKLVVLR